MPALSPRCGGRNGAVMHLFLCYMLYKQIIDKYYAQQPDLMHILMVHSEAVAQRALRICDAHPELGADRQFVFEAAMLHDIGIVQCDAPGICCHGTQPYICHGILGAEMLRAEGLERHARVCERHTGAGLSADDIIRQQLPLPHRDFLPVSIEEQIICYADKFYSKSHIDREKTLAQAEKTIARFGQDSLDRFLQWEHLFEG